MGRHLDLERLAFPEGSLRLADLASLMMDWAAGLPSSTEDVSCRKGCGACCRQLVTVSPAEAFLMADHAETLPAERQAVLEERAAIILERLPQLPGGNPFQSPPDYFRLGFPCPWLEEESCSVHARRPFICREHLVLSPAEYCSEFPHPFIRPVYPEITVGALLAEMSAELLGWAPTRIMLAIAPAWARAHPEERARAWDAGFLRGMAEEKIILWA